MKDLEDLVEAKKAQIIEDYKREVYEAGRSLALKVINSYHPDYGYPNFKAAVLRAMSRAQERMDKVDALCELSDVVDIVNRIVQSVS